MCSGGQRGVTMTLQVELAPTMKIPCKPHTLRPRSTRPPLVLFHSTHPETALYTNPGVKPWTIFLHSDVSGKAYKIYDHSPIPLLRRHPHPRVLPNHAPRSNSTKLAERFREHHERKARTASRPTTAHLHVCAPTANFPNFAPVPKSQAQNPAPTLRDGCITHPAAQLRCRVSNTRQIDLDHPEHGPSVLRPLEA